MEKREGDQWKKRNEENQEEGYDWGCRIWWRGRGYNKNEVEKCWSSLLNCCLRQNEQEICTKTNRIKIFPIKIRLYETIYDQWG